ncbi:MAG: XdhC family protein [Candidatus Omnitrophica bacterium]|nr:XdhC family protein [Candidatus Omnitrophota bacterium]
MDTKVLDKIIELSKKNCAYAIATVVSATKGTPGKTGAKMIVQSDGASIGTVGGGMVEKKVQSESLNSIKTGMPDLKTYTMKGKGWPICGGEVSIFIEPYLGPKKLIICGAGHIALPLSLIAKILQFEITIIDERKAFANKNRFPHVDKIFCKHPEYLAKINIDANTHIVIITHNHINDFACLKNVIKSDAGYIGVISSQKKRLLFLKNLKKIGVTKAQLEKLNIPVGIDIGAQTPEEIAVSIMAEIITINNKNKIGTEKFKIKR